MQGSIHIPHDPAVEYLLRLGDTTLILGQRLSEWCGHAPILEEDIALTNMALDLIGQTRALFTRVGELASQGRKHVLSEDQIAFLREERDYRNLTVVELPRGDFAFTIVRNLMVSTWLFRRLAQAPVVRWRRDVSAAKGQAERCSAPRPRVVKGPHVARSGSEHLPWPC